MMYFDICDTHVVGSFVILAHKVRPFRFQNVETVDVPLIYDCTNLGIFRKKRLFIRFNRFISQWLMSHESENDLIVDKNFKNYHLLFCLFTDGQVLI